jgi:hypothetical protein
MTETLRALVVVLVLASIVFAFSRKAVCEGAVSQHDFVLRRNLWFAITLAAFLSFNFWVFIGISAVIILIGLPRENNRLALFFALMFVVPQISISIPGMGLLDNLFAIDLVRLLALLVLLPTSLALRKREGTIAFGRTFPDKLLALYLILQFLLLLKATSGNDAIRRGLFYGFVDVFLPYYVASRLPMNLRQFRDAIAAFTVAVLILAAIGTFEYLKHWLLYQNLATSLSGGKWPWGYLARGEGLRAVATTGQPIPLGYVITVAMALWFYMKMAVPSLLLWRSAMALLIAGLIATISRGPWAGAIAMILMYSACGPTPATRLFKTTLTGGLLFTIALATPLGAKIVDLIPFVGTIEPQNAEYRQLFVQQSWIVIKQHPWFGSVDFILAPEFIPLKAQGLLDTLNVFLAIGLFSGFVGIALFAGIILAVGVGTFRAMRNQIGKDPERHLLGRSLFCALFAIVVIINTVSAITIIPLVYWCITGLCVAYVQMCRRGPEQLGSTVATEPRVTRLRKYSLAK